MKVLKRGTKHVWNFIKKNTPKNDPKLQGGITKCNNCKSKIQYNKENIKIKKANRVFANPIRTRSSYGDILIKYYFICPVCNEDVIIRKDVEDDC